MYLIRRLLLMIVVLVTVITITFVLMQRLPGKPYPPQLARNEAQVQRLEEKYDLKAPPIEKYIGFWTGLAKGELGYSIVKMRPVNEVIGKRVPTSMSVGIFPVLIGFIFGITTGVIAALKRNSIIDYIATIIAVVGVSIPSFIIATYLQYNAPDWGLPVTFSARNAGLSVYILPVIALSFGAFATSARFTRTQMIECLNSDYVLLARAKGASEISVVFKHAFRNALIPIVTILPFSFLLVITGSIVIESIFSIPGMGKTMVEAINGNDYPMILGVTFFYTVLILGAYFLVDILYVIVDPRIRIGGKK